MRSNNKGVKRNYLIITALLLCVCGVLALLSLGGPKELTADEIDKLDADETYPQALGSLVVYYHDVEEIIADADLIVYGTPSESEVVSLNGFPQTHTTFRITETIKGKAENKEIEVIEEGGGWGDMVAGGIPKLNSSNDYVLFLRASRGAYYICGAFQGRFIEKSGYVFQQATEDVKLERSAYAPIRTEEFIAAIKDLAGS